MTNLVTELGDAGLKCQPLIVQANGGLATPAQTIPIFTVESGPAAGVVGSAHLANQLGVPNVIATDVGGTTFKVAVIEGGKWAYVERDCAQPVSASTADDRRRFDRRRRRVNRLGG